MGQATTDGPATNGIWGWLPVLIPLAIFGWSFSFLGPISNGEVLRFSSDWVPSLGISLSFLVDGLSLTFTLLISGIGALVLLYSNTYLAGHPQYGRFSLYLVSFMLAMLGLVLSDNLISLFVFWELTTITSYLLIGFDNESAKSRRSALQALLLTGAGALALLAGLILLGVTAGTFEISVILAKGDEIRAHALYLPILILILAGAFTKSAQVPFHFWLPNAMAAPTPVSAFLHSATMVKAGVYLMARMHPAFSGTEVWMWTLTIFGATTAVFASFLALRQNDLKQALAYTTLMALGTLTMFLGSDTGYAITAFITFLIVHSLYKAALFLIVGCIDHETGTRRADILGGLGRAMPITAAAAALSAMSMAGFPPFLGFIGKELKYAGAIAVTSEPFFVAGAALLANSLMLAVAGVVAFKPFWRTTGEPLPKTPHEAPWPMLAGPVILAALGAVLGIAPGLIQNTLITPTVDAMLGAPPTEAKELKLWAGVNIPLFLSIATFVLGLALYAVHPTLRNILARLDDMTPSFDRGWDRILDGLKALAGWQTRLIQSGVLRRYMFIIFATFVAVIGATLYLRTDLPTSFEIEPLAAKQWAVIILMIAGTLVTVATRSRITAIASLGVVGITVALVFIMYGAPDVAITQLLVETLIVVLVAVAMLRLPFLDRRGESDHRPLDALLAIGVGTVTTITMLLVLEQPLDLRLTEYFEATSWPEAFGRNIVNVILVDFRALDTFGEIAVVVIAALSAYALLRTTAKEAGK
ncbi:putative monovalent cation/H+ antiporter subunit A [Parasulfitobacter algicola]|uniref:Monovalent cation/H+ antiporter subunit A n=1 Tax=Parasulfitobacter algicola TaxID=2614809 RepID=A0ABX2IMV2_9RHOB|nr:putative monovalent cation/H+ antiporter subunit A [Sulfitobacter algicola]NSX53306.1 putative monovalent cation/H+ antiporter subunit A [Sulfitobacter algicola]